MESASPKTVFLSYAREDTAAAQRIAEALRSHGVEVWFDQNELRGGDAWDAKIRKQIRDCALFMPVISAHTQTRSEGYFRLEWKLAVERTHRMAEGMPFLSPVVIDDTPDAGAVVPGEFMRVQWTRLTGGLPTSQFVEQSKRLLAAPSASASAQKARPRAAPSSPAARAGSGFPIWISVALGALVLGLGAYFFLRPATQQAPAASSQAAADQPPAPVATAPPVGDKSIAVLPFVNRSVEKENEFFTDGLHDDIVANLSQVAELRVASNASVTPFRGTSKSPREIGAELHVAYLLTGSVQRVGNRVHLSNELVNVRTETALAKTFDRDIKDIFGVQSELAQAIAADLNAVISPDEKSLLEGHPTENLAAYELFLKANAYWQRVTASEDANFVLSEPLLRKAVELDPNFLKAWGALLGGYAYRYGTGHPSPELLAKAKAAFGEVMRIAPESRVAMLRGARYYLWCLGDFDHAIESTERFIRLQPNDPEGYFTLEVIQFREGKLADAIANLRSCFTLEPTDWFYHRYLYGPMEGCRRYEELIPEIQQIVANHPEFKSDWPRLVFTIFRARGSTREGDDYFGSLPAAVANSPAVIAQRKTWAAMRGDLDEFLRLDALLPESSGVAQRDRALELAVALLAKGDNAGARAQLGPLENAAIQWSEKNPMDHAQWRTAAQIAAVLGHAELAQHCLQQLEALPAQNTSPRHTAADNLRVRAFVDTFLGDKTRAIEEYRRLFGMVFGDLNVYEMRHEAAYAPLRGDPRFETLLNDPKNKEPLL